MLNPQIFSHVQLLYLSLPAFDLIQHGDLFFQTLQSRLRATRVPQETACSSLLFTFLPPSCFRTLGLPPSPAPAPGGVWKPAGDQLHRAAERAGSPPALPPRQIRDREPDRSKSGGASTCAAAVSESSSRPDVMDLFVVFYFAQKNSSRHSFLFQVLFLHFTHWSRVTVQNHLWTRSMLSKTYNVASNQEKTFSNWEAFFGTVTKIRKWFFWVAWKNSFFPSWNIQLQKKIFLEPEDWRTSSKLWCRSIKIR